MFEDGAVSFLGVRGGACSLPLLDENNRESLTGSVFPGGFLLVQGKHTFHPINV